jgi:hypothetical protein
VALNTLNHNYGQPLVVSSLNTTGNIVVDGSLTVLGSSTLASASIGAVTAGQIQYLSGLTSDVQIQLNNRLTSTQLTTALTAYAPLAGAAFTGAISATALTLSTTPLAVSSGGSGLTATTKGGLFVGNSTTAFTNLPVGTDTYLLTADSSQATGLKWAAAPVSLPSQTGNSGYYLTTNGTTASWAAIQALPTQTSNSGKYLTTDGTAASWATLTASSLTGGTLSSTILGNSTVYIGSTAVALNRATGNLGLTGISSVAFPGSTSGTITVQAAATAGTNTITLPAATGTVDLQGNTFYVGTTSIANNRASASQTLTGVSIDGNAATATNGLTTGNYNSYAPTLTGTGASGTWGISITGNAATATTAASTTNGLTTSNYSSYALPIGGGVMNGMITGTAQPSTVTVLTANDTGNFSVRGSGAAGSPATMSFHRPGIFATNMGIDTDNVFKIGGWSAGLMISLTGSNCTLPGSLTINSDAKLKENLVPISKPLDKVHALTGYNYNRIGSDKLEMGVVAQEVQKILPELIHEDSEGTLSVAYQNMVALLIEAVKEQSAKIAALEEQVKELKG